MGKYKNKMLNDHDFDVTCTYIIARYPEVKKETIDRINPLYSCVICKKYSDCKEAKEGNSCALNEQR